MDELLQLVPLSFSVLPTARMRSGIYFVELVGLIMETRHECALARPNEQTTL